LKYRSQHFDPQEVYPRGFGVRYRRDRPAGPGERPPIGPPSARGWPSVFRTDRSTLPGRRRRRGRGDARKSLSTILKELLTEARIPRPAAWIVRRTGATFRRVMSLGLPRSTFPREATADPRPAYVGSLEPACRPAPVRLWRGYAGAVL